MGNAILIRTGSGVEASSFLSPNEKGEVYLNLSAVSSFTFYTDTIGFEFHEPSGEPHSIHFNSNSMGEYQRIKKEIKEIMNVVN
jgi:hypothetical protein